MKEADAQNDTALEQILKEYDDILSENGTNIVSKSYRPSANLCAPGQGADKDTTAYHQETDRFIAIARSRTGCCVFSSTASGLLAQ